MLSLLLLGGGLLGGGLVAGRTLKKSYKKDQGGFALQEALGRRQVTIPWEAKSLREKTLPWSRGGSGDEVGLACINKWFNNFEGPNPSGPPPEDRYVVLEGHRYFLQLPLVYRGSGRVLLQFMEEVLPPGLRPGEKVTVFHDDFGRIIAFAPEEKALERMVMEESTTGKALKAWRLAGGHLTPEGLFLPPLDSKPRDKRVFGRWLRRTLAEEGLKPASLEVVLLQDGSGRVQALKHKPLPLEGSPGSKKLPAKRPAVRPVLSQKDLEEKSLLWKQQEVLAAQTGLASSLLKARKPRWQSPGPEPLETAGLPTRKPALAPALARLPGALPEAPAYAGPKREALIERLEKVHEDYSRRREDICEVIEHNALFQLRFKATRDFEVADLRLRDCDLAKMPVEDLLAQVTEVEVLYRAAVEYAEYLGYEALKDPTLGVTASKLAITAARGSTLSERMMARSKLEEALKTLRLPVPQAQLEALCPRELEAPGDASAAFQ